MEKTFVGVHSYSPSAPGLSYSSGNVIARQRKCHVNKGRDCFVILTSAHSVQGRDRWSVLPLYQEGHEKRGQFIETEVPAKLLALFPHYDLATLEVKSEDFPDADKVYADFGLMVDESYGVEPLSHCEMETGQPIEAMMRFMVTPMYYGYSYGEINPWRIVPSRHGIWEVSPEGEKDTKEKRDWFLPWLKTLPYLQAASRMPAFFAFRGMSGALVWGCTDQKKVAPQGMMIRGDLNFHESYSISWPIISQLLPHLVKPHNQNSEMKSGWKIEMEHQEDIASWSRVYIDIETGMKVSDSGAGESLVSNTGGGEGVDTGGGEGVDTGGGEGVDTGGGEGVDTSGENTEENKEYYRSALVVEAIQQSEEGLDFGKLIPQFVLQDIHKSFLKRPDIERSGAQIEYAGSAYRLNSFKGSEVYGAADLLYKAQYDVNSILAEVKGQGKAQAPKRLAIERFGLESRELHHFDVLVTIRQGQLIQPERSEKVSSSRKEDERLFFFWDFLKIELEPSKKEIKKATMALPNVHVVNPNLRVIVSGAKQFLLGVDADPYTWFQIYDRDDGWQFDVAFLVNDRGALKQVTYSGRLKRGARRE